MFNFCCRVLDVLYIHCILQSNSKKKIVREWTREIRPYSAWWLLLYGTSSSVTPWWRCLQFQHCWITLHWRHDERDGVSNHRPHDCLLNRLFRRRSKKTSKLRVTGLCAGNSPVTGEFPAQRASNAETFPFDDVIIVREIRGPVIYTLGCFFVVSLVKF